MQPVRLELLALESLSIRPVQRSNTLSRMMRPGRSDSSASGRISPDPALAWDTHPGSADTYYPLSIQAHGKHGASYTLYTRTVEERSEWRRKMREAIEARKAVREAGSIFRLETITADTASSQEVPAQQAGLVTGRVFCTLPFGRHGPLRTSGRVLNCIYRVGRRPSFHCHRKRGWRVDRHAEPTAMYDQCIPNFGESVLNVFSPA